MFCSQEKQLRGNWILSNAEAVPIHRFFIDQIFPRFSAIRSMEEIRLPIVVSIIVRNDKSFILIFCSRQHKWDPSILWQYINFRREIFPVYGTFTFTPAA